MTYYNSTIKRYSFLWSKSQNTKPPKRYHFNSMQEVIPEEIVRGSIGLDIGCGCGWDTFIMAKNNPSVRIIGMDISESVYRASQLNNNLKNAIMLRGSAADIPLKNETCDFVYSFGVLHHMSDYKKAFLEISRVLKIGSPSFLYLYEDHSGDLFKYTAIKMIVFIRKITMLIPSRILYWLSCAISPIFVILFSWPAKIFKKYRLTYKLYEKMPFNFGGPLLSLKGDLYDRFGAPIEIRFDQEMLRRVFMECNFTNIQITRLKATAGWVAWAYKN